MIKVENPHGGDYARSWGPPFSANGTASAFKAINPAKRGVSIVDLSTGMWSVIGIRAALQRRTHTGRGGLVDTSLYESALAWMSVPIAAYLCSDEMPQKAGSGAAQIVPSQAFATTDGHVMVAAGNDNARLHAAGVPCGPNQTVDQVVAHAQTKALGMIQDAPGGALSLVGLPLSFDGVRPGFGRHPPALGEHAAEVLPVSGPCDASGAR